MKFIFKPLLFVIILISGFSYSQDDEFLRRQNLHSRVRGAREEKTADILALFRSRNMQYPPEGIILVAYKMDAVLELWAKPAVGSAYVHMKDYAICMRSGEPGPKRKEGDFQVPEGFYEVVLFNPVSSYHLSFKINYPNASDRILSDRRHPGGLIYIHGSCVTIGCIPITDRWIKELYLIMIDTHAHTGENAPVYIFPTRMNATGMARLDELSEGKPQLRRFWRNLMDGYNRWRVHHKKITFTVNRDGSYRYR